MSQPSADSDIKISKYWHKAAHAALILPRSEASTPLSRAKMGGNGSPPSIGVTVQAHDPSESEAVISTKAFSFSEAQVALMCRRRPKEQAVNLPLATGIDVSWFTRIIRCEASHSSPRPNTHTELPLGRANDSCPPWGTFTQQSILIAQAHHRDWLGLIWPSKRETSAHQSLPSLPLPK